MLFQRIWTTNPKADLLKFSDLDIFRLIFPVVEHTAMKSILSLQSIGFDYVISLWLLKNFYQAQLAIQLEEKNYASDHDKPVP